MTKPSGLVTPALILAADHRARGVITMEDYASYRGALAKAFQPAMAFWPRRNRWAIWPMGATSTVRSAPISRSTAPDWLGLPSNSMIA